MLHILWYVDEYILLLQRMFSSLQFSFVSSTAITSQQQNKKSKYPLRQCHRFYLVMWWANLRENYLHTQAIYQRMQINHINRARVFTHACVFTHALGKTLRNLHLFTFFLLWRARSLLYSTFSGIFVWISMRM